MDFFHFDEYSITVSHLKFGNPNEETPEIPAKRPPGVEEPPAKAPTDIDDPAYPSDKGKQGIDRPRVPENPELDNPDGY